MRKKIKMSQILAFVSSIMLVGIVLLSFAYLGVRLLGYETFPVLNSDMAPQYRLGSLAYIKKVDKNDIKAGTVISYRQGNGASVSVQRVESVIDGGAKFRMMSNQRSDIENEEILLSDIIGCPQFSIPVVGYFAVMVRNKAGFFFLSMFVLLLVYLNFSNYFFNKLRIRRDRLF